MRVRSREPARHRPADRPVVICVDDDPAVLSSIARLLRGEPYDLLGTTDPEVALDWVRSRPVNVIVADHRMPDMRGTTLLQLVKSISPSTGRLLLTAHREDPAVVSAWDRGLLGLIGKPWNDELLKMAIRDRL